MSVQTYAPKPMPGVAEECHMEHAHAGSVPNYPLSAETSMCGHVHAFNTFPVQTVHLAVDSGELGQPDVTFGLEGMVREPTYNDAHAGKKLIWRFWCWMFVFVSLRATRRVPRSLGD